MPMDLIPASQLTFWSNRGLAFAGFSAATALVLLGAPAEIRHNPQFIKTAACFAAATPFFAAVGIVCASVTQKQQKQPKFQSFLACMLYSGAFFGSLGITGAFYLVGGWVLAAFVLPFIVVAPWTILFLRRMRNSESPEKA